MMILALTIGFLGMHLMLVRPLKKELDLVRRGMEDMQDQVQQLAGTSDGVWDANSLLAALRNQQQNMEQARLALDEFESFRSSVQSLRTAVQSETAKANEAVAGMARLRTLSESLVSQSDMTAPATRALEQLLSLQDRLIDQQASIVEATRAIDRLGVLKQRALSEVVDADAAEANLDQLAELKFQLICQADRVEEAMANLKRLAAMKNIIVQETDDLDTAMGQTDQLLALKERIVIRGGNTQSARDSIERLLTLRDSLLEENVVGLDEARDHAQKLVALKDLINSEGTGVEAAWSIAARLSWLKDAIITKGGSAVQSLPGVDRLTTIEKNLPSPKGETKIEKSPSIDLRIETLPGEDDPSARFDRSGGGKHPAAWITGNWSSTIQALPAAGEKAARFVVNQFTIGRAAGVVEPFVALGWKSRPSLSSRAKADAELEPVPVRSVSRSAQFPLGWPRSEVFQRPMNLENPYPTTRPSPVIEGITPWPTEED